MNLKELWENCTGDEIRSILEDYLTLPAEYRIKYTFEDYIADLRTCDNCKSIEREEDLYDTENMVNGGIGKICENCLNDME